MEQITVFEHEKLLIGREKGFTQAHFNALEKFRNVNDEFPYYELISKGIRFKHYVGLLSVGNLNIEILPKADEGGKGSWHNRLIYMLARVYKLNITMPSSASQNKQPHSVFEIFIKHFLDEVDILLNRGLVKCYHQKDGNLTTLKGKILWNKQLSVNCAHKERFYVNYTTYDREHLLNRIIRKALSVITTMSISPSLRGRATTTLFNFPEVKDICVTAELFDNLVFDRKTQDYDTAVKIAKLILMNYMPDLTHGKENVLAMMFDMNKLWEEFVFCVLKSGLANSGYIVKPQVQQNFWISDVGNKIIKPDIVINDKNDKIIAILDTKWKRPSDNKPSDADLHQIFTYSTCFNSNKVALVYPGDEGCVKGRFVSNSYPCPLKASKCIKAECDMLYLPCSDDVNKWGGEICAKVEKWIKGSSISTVP